MHKSILRVARRVDPNLDAHYWQLARWRATRLGARALRPQASRLANARVPGRQPSLLVVPDFGPRAQNWHVGGGSLLFETYQSAKEILGDDRVSLFERRENEDRRSWHARLIETIADTGATHVLAQIESDPEEPEGWSWDEVAAVLDTSWDGVLIGFMYDSAYDWLRLRARRLGRTMRNVLIADLSTSVDGIVAAGRTEAGPFTMPFSQASVARVDAHVSEMAKEFDVSFIGALYDYRVDLLDKLRAAGLRVAVNPHRPDETRTYLESRANKPTYLDYMAGLARSQMTINFSLASGGPHEQNKLRVWEASLVGCLALTDDTAMTRRFFSTDDYGYFADLQTLPQIVSARLADPERLRRVQQAARKRAHELASVDFWGRIDDGLRRRSLPELTGLRPPPPPDGAPTTSSDERHTAGEAGQDRK